MSSQTQTIAQWLHYIHIDMMVSVWHLTPRIQTVDMLLSWSSQTYRVFLWHTASLIQFPKDTLICSLVKCLNHRGVASDTVCRSLGCDAQSSCRIGLFAFALEGVQHIMCKQGTVQLFLENRTLWQTLEFKAKKVKQCVLSKNTLYMGAM